MKRTLRWQFLLPLLVFFTIAFAGIDLYLSKAFLTIYQNHLKDNLSAEASLIINELSESVGFPDTINHLQTMVNRYGETLGARVTVVRPDGVVLADSLVDAATMENHLSRPEVQQALMGNAGYEVRYSTTLKEQMLYVAVPVIRGDQVVLIVRLARSLESIENDVRGLNRTILISGIISLLLLLGITFLIFRKTTEPLDRLIDATRDFSFGNLKQVRVRKHGNELDGLASAFNQMAVKINDQMQDLHEQTERLSNILNQMQDGVVIVSEKGIIQSINPAAEKMFDVVGVKAIGEPLIQVLQYYQVSELFRQTLESGTQNSSAIDISQRSLYLQAIGSVLQDPDGRSVLLLFQDTSRQRQLEAMRKDFVSNVSHELRTPLASLRALSDTLENGALEDLPAARRFVELMDVEIAKLTQMVDELLELSRIESGTVKLNLKATDPCEMIRSTLSRMELQAKRSGLTLTGVCDENAPEVWVDCEQIEQVLINLIHNAIKFTPPGGSITVTACMVDGTVEFEVRDTGVGIAREDLPRIFERFYKSDRSRATRGTGLGLSIVKHVIENHGGRGWVDSEPGQGSAFSFSIPIKPKTD